MKEKKMENLHDLKNILQNLMEDLEEEIVSCQYLLENDLFENITDKMAILTDSIEAAKAISVALKSYQHLFGAGS